MDRCQCCGKLWWKAMSGKCGCREVLCEPCWDRHHDLGCLRCRHPNRTLT